MATKRDRVASHLRTAIATGQMKPGQQLPIESKLMEDYDVSRSTVRWAMSRLREEGLVTIEQGRGTFVSERDERTDHIPRYSPARLSQSERNENRGAHFHDAMQQEARVVTQVYFERADQAVSEQLDIAPGNEVCVRDRVMTIGGEPTQLATSRLPRSITQGTQIEDNDTGPGGLLGRLQDLGFELAHPVERVTIQRANAADAQALNIAAGSGVFRITRIQPDTEGRILEVNSMTLTDRYELVYEIPMGR